MKMFLKEHKTLGLIATGMIAGMLVVALITTAFAAGGLRIASGVYGTLSGYGNATVVCTDAEGNILNGVTIETTQIPLNDGSGNVGTGVTFTCP